jgi:acyl-CoA hydrolase/GNAT superfamily N-acetyltransferase
VAEARYNKEQFEKMRRQYPDKFIPEEEIFTHIHRGDTIFISTGCSEPQHLVNALINYVSKNPKAIFDAEVLHVWTFGVAPYTDTRFQHNFRHNSFFIGNSTRNAVNQGLADYTPIFLSQVPALFYRGAVPIDVALIQTTPPDSHGYMSLGISVDIIKAAIEKATTVIAQVNNHMPRVQGDGFINIADVDFIVPYDEPILEFPEDTETEVAQGIGKYVAHLVQDGDTIQVGYGSIPNAVLANLHEKKHLGIHTELLSDGIVELMKLGVIDNSRKSIDRGKTVASFCMGKRSTYEFLHDNPAIEFKTIDYTNNPLIIAQHRNMTAINSALEIDLTGQATAESIGKMFYSGIGGQADFMRGALLASGGRTILAIPSTAEHGTISRIVPFLKEGAGATLIRGDIYYVVTEYGIAYLHGKNIRERAMELIAIAHPKFRSWLLEEAKKRNLIYQDQALITGKGGEYPEELETHRTTRTGLEILLRPIKISDESLLKDFFYSLSDQSLYRRFMSTRKDMPHERLQEYVIIDYTKGMAILAMLETNGTEKVIGLSQYWIDEATHTADVAFAVSDDYQDKGIGGVLLNYVTYLAKRQGLLGFTADVLAENRSMLDLFKRQGFEMESHPEVGSYQLKMIFRD